MEIEHIPQGTMAEAVRCGGAGDWLFKEKPEEVVLQTGVFSHKRSELFATLMRKLVNQIEY